MFSKKYCVLRRGLGRQPHTELEQLLGQVYRSSIHLLDGELWWLCGAMATGAVVDLATHAGVPWYRFLVDLSTDYGYQVRLFAAAGVPKKPAQLSC